MGPHACFAALLVAWALEVTLLIADAGVQIDSDMPNKYLVNNS